jgi:undecaprenyl phosphate-alpha-L-ara4N flippase subunit ArnF
MSGVVVWRSYALALFCVLLASAAQLSLKLGVSRLEPLESANLLTLLQAAGAGAVAWLGFGLVCYLLSMLLWIRVLMHLPLSMAYPLLSISYVLVYLVATSWSFWGETASTARSAGIGLILLGVILVSLPAKQIDTSKTELR